MARQVHYRGNPPAHPQRGQGRRPGDGRDAGGEFLPRIATTGVIRGGSFLVVWVARSEEWARALHEGDVPEQIPWPATDVWVPGEEPVETGGTDG